MRRVLYKIFLIVFLISSVLLSMNLIEKIKYEKDNDESISVYFEKEKIEEKEKIKNKRVDIDIENEYIGVISIPSIGLTHGFYHQISTNNTLKSGIKNLKDDMDSILVLASHSGRSNIAKFNDLKKIKQGDVIELSYNNEDYKYIYDHSYKVDKTGHIYVKYDTSKKALVLITCDLSNNKKQVVYISYML